MKIKIIYIIYAFTICHLIFTSAFAFTVGVKGLSNDFILTHVLPFLVQHQTSTHMLDYAFRAGAIMIIGCFISSSLAPKRSKNALLSAYIKYHINPAISLTLMAILNQEIIPQSYYIQTLLAIVLTIFPLFLIWKNIKRFGDFMDYTYAGSPAEYRYRIYDTLYQPVPHKSRIYEDK